MFNSRDEKLELDETFYNPYTVGKNVENRVTGEVAKIINIENDVVTLQMNIDKDLDSTEFINIGYDEMLRNFKKCERIIIGKLTSEEKLLHAIFGEKNRENIGFVVIKDDIGRPIIVPKSYAKKKTKAKNIKK